MITKLAGMAVVTAILAASGPALATPTTLSYNGFTVVNDLNVDIAISAGALFPGSPAVPTETVGSGQIQLSTSSGFVPAWCISIFQTLTTTGTYTLGPSAGASDNGTAPPTPAGTPPTGAALTGTQIGEIGALMDYGDAYIGNPIKDPSPHLLSSATQIAIWMEEYNGGPTGGPLLFTDVDSTGNVAEAMALLAMNLSPDSNWLALTSTSQGLVTNQSVATTNVNVPEPASIALLGVGLAALGVVRRRKDLSKSSRLPPSYQA